MPSIGGSSDSFANILTAHGREPTDFPDDCPLGKGDLHEPREPVPEFEAPQDEDGETEEIDRDGILDTDSDDPDDGPSDQPFLWSIGRYIELPSEKLATERLKKASLYRSGRGSR
ncbi:hypothetical protein [Ensifer sp. ZNC0028]|uniref:hypothetical protein n=1 Tax=Ensifer sp. ZNC0028 TaxID=1339236 RepID=UPI0012E03FBB|nr:hypothetical protein [Ensifer sp. ZNC0028]